VKDSHVRLTLEVEKVFSPEGDRRELGLGIHEVEILHAR
jgi:hypothetical protein